MTIFYIVLEVIALLAIIILPLFGPKKKKVPTQKGISGLAVNEGGYLEHFIANPTDHHPVL
jgi:hypothetical protein